MHLEDPGSYLKARMIIKVGLPLGSHRIFNRESVDVDHLHA